MQDLARQDAQEARGEAGPVKTPASTPKSLARPEASEAVGGANGEVVAPPRNRGGRPRGSPNKDRLAIRRWISPKAKKLTLKQINIAHQIFDDALAGKDVVTARLEFAGSVAKQAREYAFGKPVESKEISGPDGSPIQTEALLPMEQMQRLGALFAAAQTQAQSQTPVAPDGPPVIDVEAEQVAGPEDRAEGVGGASRGSGGCVCR